MAKKDRNTAAFFRLEGVLLPRGTIFPSLYIAANSQGFRERFSRLGQLALTAPVSRALAFADRAVSTRLLHLAFRGMSEDRLAVLGDELVEDILKNRINKEALDLVRTAESQGHLIVLISETISQIVQPLSLHIGAVDHLLCNHLAFRNRLATGKLVAPTIGGTGTRRAVLELAATHGIDLGGSVAFAANRSDQLLLATVGKPCVVNPDPLLRWTAKQADWPVMDFRP